jgi:AraC-like DNA-binding protein
MGTYRGNGSAENWLAGAIREYRRAADFRPANCAELYERLAQLAVATPRPRTTRDEICGRHLLREACLRITASVVGERPPQGDALLRWPSLWAALTLIGTAEWGQLAAELRELARQNRGTEPLPRRVERHLRAHFASTCKLIDVARDAGASTRVLTKTFRQHYNCTVHQFLCSLRLRAAVRLLEESDLKISAVCASVGYGSQVDLYRQLRRITGLTPAAIRSDRTAARDVLRTLDQWLSSHGFAV